MTSAQGEALLDVLDQCSEVTATWNQRALVARNSKRKTGAVETLQKEVSDSYQESKEKLAFLFKEAVTIGCDEKQLLGILHDNLPGAVIANIMSELETS